MFLSRAADPLLKDSYKAESLRAAHTGSDQPSRGPKYWSFTFTISPSSEYSVLVSCRTDWLDLSAVQGSSGKLIPPHCHLWAS